MASEPRELPAKKTPVTIEALWNALLVNWEYLGVNPTRAGVNLYLAHIVSETGLEHCWNFNIGNKKSKIGDGRCWQFFRCGEEVPLWRATVLERMLPGHVKAVSKAYMRNGVAMVSVMIEPPHPWTRFQAFESLDEGVIAQHDYLRRHPNVLSALQTGEPAEYNRMLDTADYYTADPGKYLSLLQGSLIRVKRQTDSYDWGDVT